MKLTAIDRNGLKMVSDRAVKALEELGKELGVKFTYEGGTYGYRSQLKIGIEVQDTGTGKSSAQLQYERYCAMWGLKPEWFGKDFYDNGTGYRVSGVNPGSPKFAMQITRISDDKTFKATPMMVKRGMETQVALGRIAA